MPSIDWFAFLLAVFAVYRPAFMIAEETGPFALCERLRGAVFARFGKDSWVTEGVGCSLCISFWLSLPAALVLRPVLDLWLIGLWMAVAGAVLALHLAVTRTD